MLHRARGDHAACEEVEPPANDCTRDRDVLVSCIDANGACVWRVHSNSVHRSEYTKTVLAHARHPSGESRSQPSCVLTTAASGKQCNSALPPQFRMPHAKRPLKPAEGAAASGASCCAATCLAASRRLVRYFVVCAAARHRRHACRPSHNLRNLRVSCCSSSSRREGKGAADLIVERGSEEDGGGAGAVSVAPPRASILRLL